MSNYWEATLELIQPPAGPQLISKPTLKPDLLQKVPFKFLHDVITAILRKTQFAQGLYSAQQLDRKWDGFDKEAAGKDAASANKVAFLSDLHRVLEECLDQPFECSAKQIVRGKDPEGANRLLQNLARAGHVLQLDGAAAVQKLHGDGAPDAAAPPQRPSSRRASKPSIASAPQEAPAEHEKGGWNAAAAPEPASPLPERPGTGHGRDGARRRDSSGAAARPASRQSSQQLTPAPEGAPAERPASQQGGARPQASAEAQSRGGGAALADLAPPEPAAPDHRSDGEAVAPARTLTAQAPARPMSAKKAPPRAPSTAEPVARRTSLRPPDQAAPRRPASRSTVRVYTEPAGVAGGGGGADDDDDVDVIQESYVRAAAVPGGAAHGALVSDMYDAKAAAEAGGAEPEAHDALNLTGGINLGRSQRRRKAAGPAAARVDVDALRGAVEALVQGVTPLARSMDHLQEDKENMRKELQGWRAEGELWQACLERERGGPEEGRASGAALEVLVRDVDKKRAAVRALKRQVLQNEARMAELVDVLVGDR